MSPTAVNGTHGGDIEGHDPRTQPRYRLQVYFSGLSLVDAFTNLSADEKRYVSQIQGRTYANANVFGLVERFNAPLTF
ncbi:hypothetical protein [Bradyrhizobium sp. Tv2a-2]|uniref:hypothetical protein n=1 Tax=Bradyrhizobium sp. Tv2a-2 TaxID=113395 RepID=UPI000467884B|nr:hypothetical protein [Bradyrhizobium sp. Tv2a-2]